MAFPLDLSQDLWSFSVFMNPAFLIWKSLKAYNFKLESKKNSFLFQKSGKIL